jgi:putative DNA methylase
VTIDEGSRRKLIEVAIPLGAINVAAAREKSIRHGHPSTLHLWWARRPLAACRAVLFAQLVDDPSAHPERFPTPQAQAAERQRLFRLLEQLVQWENSSNEQILGEARAEIRRSLGDNTPALLDPFAGGGSIPLEAQRLGLDVYASDLNPVAVLINKALVELPSRFANQPPIHPNVKADLLNEPSRQGAHGLAEDVRYYGAWMREEAKRRLGHLYPEATLPDGTDVTVIAWLWARTVTCPNPACNGTAPLMNSFVLSKRKNKDAWLRPTPDARTGKVAFEVVTDGRCPVQGSVSRTGAICLICGSPMPLAYVRGEGKAGRMRAQLVAIVAEGARGRHYLTASERHEQAADIPRPDGAPATALPEQALGFRVQGYGMTHHVDLFTPRQLTLLLSMASLVDEARERALGDGAREDYANAIATYLALFLGRIANRCSSQSFWNPNRDTVEQVFARNALPMIWVYAEANPFSESSGNVSGQLDYLVSALRAVPASGHAVVRQANATTLTCSELVCVSTDPPYYDNVPYADLSDFFYVWLRPVLGSIYPELFGTLLTPKKEELIAEPARMGSWDEAARFFETGLRQTFTRIAEVHRPDLPYTIFYAFKQAEDSSGNGLASTGWETMLQGLLDSGACVVATWPIRTEQSGGLREHGRNALASSVVLACRSRLVDAGVSDRRGFVAALRAELPRALRELQQASIAPVDLAQAAIGPGMAVFSRYAKVVESDGSPMRVRAALGLINQALDEVLAEQEGEFDPDTRWAVSWFEQHAFSAGRYGDAETLSKAKVTSVRRLADIGIVHSRAGAVRLLRREELNDDWQPGQTEGGIWALTQHLIRVLEADGEAAAAHLVARAPASAEQARDLAYRLFVSCDRRGWAAEAPAFNALVTSWPEMTRLAAAQQVDGVQESLL